jgi:hypothetical protein
MWGTLRLVAGSDTFHEPASAITSRAEIEMITPAITTRAKAMRKLNTPETVPTTGGPTMKPK